MFRQSFARFYSSFGQQRKLFLLVFLWTCICLVIFKSSLLNAPIQSNSSPATLTGISSKLVVLSEPKLHERAAFVSSFKPEKFSQLVNLESSSQSSSSSSSSSNILSKPHAKSTTSNVYNAPLDANLNYNNKIAGSQCKYNYPSLFDLQFNNIHWQKFTIKASLLNLSNDSTSNSNSNDTNANTNTSSYNSDATYYLYNAYYDDRWRAGLPSIRILAMIDRIQPPPTNCLLWSSKLRFNQKLVPLVTKATFVYAWYPKWGNYKDGLLQPWIVTCPLPASHANLVPDSVSLSLIPAKLKPKVSSTSSSSFEEDLSLNKPFGSSSAPIIEFDSSHYYEPRNKRNVNSEANLADQQAAASIAMPPSFSSSSAPSASPSLLNTNTNLNRQRTTDKSQQQQVTSSTNHQNQYDCSLIESQPITNNLPVFNQRPAEKSKFAVCVKGLDFPHEDISVRLVEWIEMLNLLGAGKIFLYELDVHENISKVLHYYQERGMVELSPLTLPGDQPNLPEYQHVYLKNRLTVKRQNELIPYNDCLYRNLNSYQYLALLDIDEIIMPMKEDHHSWYDLMAQVESWSLAEQNYSRASYNVRNVYFFDDLAGPLGTSSAPDTNEVNQSPNEDNLERGIPHYLHMMQHVYRSKNYTKPGQYVKCFHNTERVVSLHNHFPMNCFGQCTTYSIPVELAHLQHYRKDCVGPLKQSCKNDYRAFTQRDTTIWKYKQQMIRRTTRVLNHLGLIGKQATD